MADEKEFQMVCRKKRRKRGQRGKNTAGKITKNLSNDSTSSYCDIGRIIVQIETYREEIRASSFYSHLKGLLTNHERIKGKEKLDNPLDGLKEKGHLEGRHFDDLICYGVGCIRTCPNARYQFALLMLLKEFFKIPSDHCCVYDPLFNDHDKTIVNNFGCSLINQNEEAKRVVTGCTFFFMPHCSKLLYNNVLWANWGETLKNVFILGNGFGSYQQRMSSKQFYSEVMYIAEILPYTKETAVPNSFHLKDIFNDSSLHCFPEDLLAKAPIAIWSSNPEPTYDINSCEIITIEKQK